MTVLRRLFPRWFDDIDYSRTEDIDWRDDYDPSEQRVPKGQPGGGQWTVSGGGAGAAPALTKYAGPAGKAMQALVDQHIKSGGDPMALGKQIVAEAGKFKSSNVAGYMNQLLGHLTKHYGVAPGTFGKAVKKIEGEANDPPETPPPSDEDTQKMAAAMPAAAPAAALPGEPPSGASHPSVASIKEIIDPKTKWGNEEKLAWVQTLANEIPDSDIASKQYAAEQIAALQSGAAPAAPEPAVMPWVEPAAPAVPDDMKPPDTDSETQTDLYKIYTSSMTNAAKIAQVKSDMKMGYTYTPTETYAKKILAALESNAPAAPAGAPKTLADMPPPDTGTQKKTYAILTSNQTPTEKLAALNVQLTNVSHPPNVEYVEQAISVMEDVEAAAPKEAASLGIGQPSGAVQTMVNDPSMTAKEKIQQLTAQMEMYGPATKAYAQEQMAKLWQEVSGEPAASEGPPLPDQIPLSQKANIQQIQKVGQSAEKTLAEKIDNIEFIAGGYSPNTTIGAYATAWLAHLMSTPPTAEAPDMPASLADVPDAPTPKLTGPSALSSNQSEMFNFAADPGLSHSGKIAQIQHAISQIFPPADKDYGNKLLGELGDAQNALETSLPEPPKGPGNAIKSMMYEIGYNPDLSHLDKIDKLKNEIQMAVSEPDKAYAQSLIDHLTDGGSAEPAAAAPVDLDKQLSSEEQSALESALPMPGGTQAEQDLWETAAMKGWTAAKKIKQMEADQGPNGIAELGTSPLSNQINAYAKKLIEHLKNNAPSAAPSAAAPAATPSAAPQSTPSAPQSTTIEPPPHGIAHLPYGAAAYAMAIGPGTAKEKAAAITKYLIAKTKTGEVGDGGPSYAYIANLGLALNTHGEAAIPAEKPQPPPVVNDPKPGSQTQNSMWTIAIDNPSGPGGKTNTEKIEAIKQVLANSSGGAGGAAETYANHLITALGGKATTVGEAQAAQIKAKTPPAWTGAPSTPSSPSKPSLSFSSEIGSAKYTEYKKASPKAKPDERDAVHKYTNGYYTQINDALRSGIGITPEIQEWSKHLRSYLERAKFPEDAVLTRKVSGDYAKKLLGNLSKGAVFIDHGFVSSDHWSGDLTIKIRIKKGQRAAAVEQYSANKPEKEIIIQRESHFRIVDYDAVQKHITVDLIDETDPDYF